MTRATSSRVRHFIGDPLVRPLCERPPACPGWDFWHYRDQAGKLVPVDALRQRYSATKKKR